MSLFRFTYRCPDCCEDVGSDQVVVERHAPCPKSNSGGEGQSLLVLVEYMGSDISRPNDPPAKGVE